MARSKKKIKITFFIPSLEGGGTERFINNLLTGLDDRNFTKSLMLEKLSKDSTQKIPQSTHIGAFHTNNNFFIFFKVIEYLHREKPDIFFSVFTVKNIIIILAKIFSRSKVKIIISERTTFSSAIQNARGTLRKMAAQQILPFMVRALYPKADAIICVSNGVANDLAKTIGVSDKLQVIYNPVNINQVLELSNREVNHAWFQDRSQPVIIAVGRLIKAKDYPTLLKAFSLVHRECQARLMILGEGNERKNLLDLIQELEISDCVALLGFQDNPYQYMARAQIFMLSSWREGFPNVILEAMACGVPVIATNCQSGPNEIIEDRKNGLLVPIQDVTALATAMETLLRNENLRRNFSERGRETAQKFSLETITKTYEKLFEDILQ